MVDLRHLVASHMTFNALINQYVGLVSTKPDYIIKSADLPIRPVNNEPHDPAKFQSIKEKIAAKLNHCSKLAIEIGSGSGAHLVEQARIDPETLFIGFELRYKRVFRTAEKAEALGLKNLLVIQLDAAYIPAIFSTQSVDAFYILFPDPWAKRRWKKHRIVNPQFLAELHLLLKDSGKICYKTDHREYFDEALSQIANSDQFKVEFLTRDLYSERPINSGIQSEFEKLFNSKRLPICMVSLQKNRKNPATAI